MIIHLDDIVKFKFQERYNIAHGTYFRIDKDFEMPFREFLERYNIFFKIGTPLIKNNEIQVNGYIVNLNATARFKNEETSLWMMFDDIDGDIEIIDEYLMMKL